MDIFERLTRDWSRRHQRAAGIAEDGMSLADIANDIKTHVASADAWLAKVVEEHVPAILAVAEKYQSSPIVAALEETVLPPEAEQQIAGLIAFLGRLGHQAGQQQPVPEQPTTVVVSHGDAEHAAEA